MTMKRILTSLLVLIMAVSMLAGCGANNGGESNSNNVVNKDNRQETVGDVKVEVLACEFDKEVMGIDEESSGYGFTERDGKVYVNLALKVTNNSSEALTEEAFSGYYEYNDLRQDLQYELQNVAPKKDNENILPGCVGVVYMLNVIEEAAMDSELTVHFSVNGKEFKEKVSPIDTRSAFEKKTKVSVGDKFNVNGLYDVEVISCQEKQYIQATNFAESEQYKAMGDDKIIDLVLKVKNNTDTNFGEIKGYAPVNGQFSWADVQIEVNNNTEFKNLGDRENDTTTEALKPGQEEYIHVCAMIEQNESADNSAVRFNIAGNCYYCEVE